MPNVTHNLPSLRGVKTARARMETQKVQGVLRRLNRLETVEAQVAELVKAGALFVVNHSGGKDSQALRIVVERMVPANQILVIHADLPGAEWAGTWEHVVYDAGHLTVLKTTAVKTFEDMVLHRGYWPSPEYRQCTSDLKRGPLEKLVRHFLVGCPCTDDGTTNKCKERHISTTPSHNGLVVNCMGIRAEESVNRSKASVFKLNKGNSKGGRVWFDYLPVHEMLETEVFSTIAADGKKVHDAYRKGMRRLSCAFCIMACGDDLRTAARENPAMFARYVATEEVIGQTFMMPVGGVKRNLEEVTGVKADQALVSLNRVELAAKRARLAEQKAA